MANTFATLIATATLSRETDVERFRLMTKAWVDGIPTDPEQLRWVESLAATTGQEMDRLMLRATNRACRVFKGKAPGTGNGFRSLTQLTDTDGKSETNPGERQRFT